MKTSNYFKLLSESPNKNRRKTDPPTPDDDASLIYIVMIWALVFSSFFIIGGCSKPDGTLNNSSTLIDYADLPIEQVPADCEHPKTQEFIKSCFIENN